MTDVPPMLLRADQVAKALGIGQSTVWRWAREGALPKPIKWRGVTVWRTKDLQEMIDGLE